MQVSINPTYLCNFRCSFCYLTKEQLSDPKTTPLDMIEDRLKEINSYQRLTGVDIYGGEIGLLDYNYLVNLDRCIRKYTDKINVITNLSRINTYFRHSDITLSVSWDFVARQGWERVLENMLVIDRPISVLMLASPELIVRRPSEVLSYLCQIPTLESIEIKPYSSNQANQLSAKGQSELEFEHWVMEWIKLFEKNHGISTRIQFENINRIKRSLSSEYSAFSDNHIYIQPNGNLAVLEFDQDHNEYFLELADMDGYHNWSIKEKVRVHNNSICSKCKYLGRCLTEHYREVNEDDIECNGFHDLLQWYELNHRT
jgi:sulfatase maturation enzyme AslB (radical SAM superfamily)